MELLGSGPSSCSSVCFQVWLFRSMVLVIGDGCCSDALVLQGLSTTTFHLSTTSSSTLTSFPSFGDGGARTAACLRLGPTFVVVARWSKDLFIIFVIFDVLCTNVDDY